MNKIYDKPCWLHDTHTRSVFIHINYVLWDCSTEFMVEHGMPSNEQVEGWIEVLESREDQDQFIELAIKDCYEYIKPYVAPTPRESVSRKVKVGDVIKVKKVS